MTKLSATPFSLLGDLMSTAMTIIRAAQMAGPIRGTRVKGDRSLVTANDLAVEDALRTMADRYELPMYGEEFGRTTDDVGRYLVVADPIDGTRPFANGHMGGSSVILYLYDTEKRRIVATMIGCPGTGEVWYAEDDMPTKKYFWNGSEFAYLFTCTVWDGAGGMDVRPTVYVDNPNPFTRRDAQMFTAPGLRRLDMLLCDAGFTKFIVGSNGLHHGIIVNGGPVAGTITTSIGGIQDLGGVLLVEQAGGVARAFRLDAQRNLHDCDPHSDLLMPGGYDFLVTAVNDDVLERLIGMLRESVLW